MSNIYSGLQNFGFRFLVGKMILIHDILHLKDNMRDIEFVFGLDDVCKKKSLGLCKRTNCLHSLQAFFNL